MASLTHDDITRLRSLVGLRLVPMSLMQSVPSAADTAEGTFEATQRWCRRMAAQGLLTTQSVLATAPTTSTPVCEYRLGDAAPDFGSVARSLRERATATAPERIAVVRLTAPGAALLGELLPRRSRRCEITHDLRLAHFVFAVRASGDVLRWTPEEQLARERAYDHVVPDGELELTTGERVVVECGGIYSKTKLASFHARVAPQLQRRGARGYVLI